MKLSAAQKFVIDLMKNEWGLATNDRFLTTQTYGKRAWLQENGIGRGGKSENINIKTVIALERLKLIKSNPAESGRTHIQFQLTELGKNS